MAITPLAALHRKLFDETDGVKFSTLKDRLIRKHGETERIAVLDILGAYAREGQLLQQRLALPPQESDGSGRIYRCRFGRGDRGAPVRLCQVAPAFDDPQCHAAGRRGTMTIASPSVTVLPLTLQTVEIVTRPLRSSMDSMRMVVWISSPIRTGRLKFSCWDR